MGMYTHTHTRLMSVSCNGPVSCPGCPCLTCFLGYDWVFLIPYIVMENGDVSVCVHIYLHIYGALSLKLLLQLFPFPHGFMT